MAASKKIDLIEKLNNNNYNNWAFKLEILLLKEDLFGMVTADSPPPQAH